MKIVHVLASRFFGGPERQMLGLAEALRGEHDSAFVFFHENGYCRDMVAKTREAGFETVALKRDMPRLAAMQRELAAALRELRADVLVCHGHKANLLGLLAGRKLRTPTIAVSRGWTGECLKVRVYEALDRFVLRWMDKVVCVSAAQAEKVRRAGVRAERVAVIHNAVRPERFALPDPAYAARLRELFPQPVEKIVGAAGRLSPEKGFKVLIDAAAEVLPSRPGTAFVLFGEGPLRPALAKQIAERKLEDRFILAGFRADLDGFLPHLDLVVLPSFSEGLPNVALEALACAVPVVATRVGGNPEVVVDGQSGRLTPPGDPGALAEAIGQLLDDDPQRRALGAGGRRRVELEFSFAAQARAYQALFAQWGAAGPVPGAPLPLSPQEDCKLCRG